ncbi:uncharacterized protein LOC129288118 [Prosopis cineraria]|uniref:uncharacterized protein LOC129288118 n=1 Tax=Prosopis cineraria TaxID=364024 RepID=UPI00240F847E|nr:uncharacterized protein LOC129288118 [Prosopis cineraria]
MSEAIGIENKEKVDFHSSNHLKLFSSNLLRLVQSLEELEVSDCGSLEVVFDVKIMDDREMQGRKTSQLKRLALSRLPNLKHIWNRDLPEILSFKNLQVTKITQCQSLKHLFSVSLCQDLQQLQDLVIMSCGIEEIVAVEGEGLEELKFYFPRLTIFRLHFLMRFKRFYPGRHYLECPSLKTLDVFGCEGLEIFSFTHLDSRQTLMVGEDDMPIQQALFSLEKVSSNLKDLALNEKDSIEILNGHYEANLFHSLEVLGLQCFQETPVMLLNRFLEKFPNIKTLGVRYSSFKVFFPSNEAGYCGFRSPNQIKKLGLQKMEQLEQIWNDDSLTDVLEELIVLDCPSLTSLGPPSIAFTSLTSLQVMYCKRLTFLMTGSTAKTLVHLKQLWIRNCGMMEVVVMINEGTPEEIKFESLEYLEMTFLPSLKSFCSGKHTFVFPSLEMLKVRGCPRMQNFSSGVIIAPTITMEVENETRHCAEDFNTTIKQLAMEQNQESL